MKVRRVPLFDSHSRSALGRLLSYGSFGWTSIFAADFIKDGNVIYVYATQMTAAIASSWWFHPFKIPFVLHAQDLWPESVTGSFLEGGKPLSRVINSFLTPWLAGIYRRTVGTIAIGPTMMRLWGERGVVGERLHTVFNWADDAGDPRDVKGKMSEPQSSRVMYAGNMVDLQDPQTALKAAALVSHFLGFQPDLVGSGIAEASFRDLAAKLKLDNVVFQGRVPVAVMGEQYSRSDFQLVPLKDLQIFRGTRPSKFQASLFSGIPVITNGAGDVSEIVLERNVGLTSTSGDPGSLAMAFRSACAMSGSARRAMGERGAELYNEGMSMTRGIDKIMTMLADAVRSSRRKIVNDVQLSGQDHPRHRRYWSLRSRGGGETSILRRGTGAHPQSRRGQTRSDAPRAAGSRLRFYAEDVRDYLSVERAMRDVDYVFHPAAFKQVPSCEFFPMEAVKTNAIGSEHMIRAAEDAGVASVVCLSTNKAVYPVHAVGCARR